MLKVAKSKMVLCLAAVAVSAVMTVSGIAAHGVFADASADGESRRRSPCEGHKIFPAA